MKFSINNRNATFIILFIIGTALGFQAIRHFQKLGHINWEFATERPFLGGWSSITGPVHDDRQIYICAGYGWWARSVVVAAIGYNGAQKWHYDIKTPCDSIQEVGSKIIALTKSYRTIKDSDSKVATVWTYSAHILNKENGSLVEFIEGPDRLFASKNSLYLEKKDSLVRVDFSHHQTGQIDLSFELPYRILQTFEDSLFYVDGESIYQWKESIDVSSKLFTGKSKITGVRISRSFLCFIESTDRPEYGQLKCLDRNSKSVVSDIQLSGSDQYTLIDQHLYYMNKDHSDLYFKNLENGESRRIEVTGRLGNILNEIDGVLYLVSGHELTAVNSKTGNLIWMYKTGGWGRRIERYKDQLLITDDDGILTSVPTTGPK